MNYGLYVSASGVLTNLYRQDVFSNNMANSQTVGYKPDMATVKARDPESIEDHFAGDVSNRLLDNLGGGALAGPQTIDFTPGQPSQTGNPLDVALVGKNEFFAVRHTDLNTGEQEVRLTRDGRFTRGPQGTLVTVSNGLPVLDPTGQPITLGNQSSIDPAGRIVEDGEAIGQLQVARVADLQQLVKAGGNLFRITGENPDAARTPIAEPSVKPGFVESSGADPVKTLLQLISANKAVSGGGNMIQYHDTIMEQAANVLGRVA